MGCTLRKEKKIYSKVKQDFPPPYVECYEDVEITAKMLKSLVYQVKQKTVENRGVTMPHNELTFLYRILQIEDSPPEAASIICTFIMDADNGVSLELLRKQMKTVVKAFA